MRELRANTQVIVTVGPFVDVTDGFTPQTDITLGGNEAELIKHGSTSVVDISGATWAAVTSCRGHYSLTLTTSHTDTPGNLRVVVQDDSDCLPVTQDFVVLTEHAWDLKYATEGSGGGIQSGKLWYGTFSAADATTITMADDTAANAIYDGTRVMVVLESGTNCTGRAYYGTVGATRVITVDPSFSADSGATPSGTIVGAVYAVPKSPTSSLPTAQIADGHLVAAKFGDACITDAKLATDARTRIATECGTALTTYDPPTKAEQDSAFTEIKGATWAAGTDTLEHIRNKQTDIETDTADLQSQIGTAGAGLTDLGGMSTDMKAEVQTECDDAITAAFGVVTSSVNDASATAASFTVTGDVGSDERIGMLRLTSGDLSGESRLVLWTGTTVTVLYQDDMNAAMQAFSAAPADAVTFRFTPIG